MIKLTFLVSMILACVAFSAANSIPITHGYGTLSGAGVGSNALYAFNFSGPGGGIAVPGVLNDNGIEAGLINCDPCDPRTTNIELLRDSGITILHGNRFVEGSFAFEPVSFSSRLAPNGILTVDYRATADFSLQACVGDPLSCNPSGPTFVSNPSQLWYVRATFTPYNGQYNFQNAVFSTSPVPEPGTLLLLGSGLLCTMGAARKKLFH